MNENFRELYPDPMANLPPLRFIEPLNPNNEKFKYPSEPYAYVADVVIQSEDVIDVTEVMNKGISAAQWDAMADLRDIIAKGEKIGWFVVHNGDRHLAQQERLRKEENGVQRTDDETCAAAEAEAIDSKYSKGLSEQVARLQVHNKSNRKGNMTEVRGMDATRSFSDHLVDRMIVKEDRQESWKTEDALPRRLKMNTIDTSKTMKETSSGIHKQPDEHFATSWCPREDEVMVLDTVYNVYDSYQQASFFVLAACAALVASQNPVTADKDSNGPGTPLGWEGIVTVDGISYEYLGTGSTTLPDLPNLQPARPLGVTYDSQYSNFTFAAGPVIITASFLSSVLPDDLCRTSIPLSYLTTSVQSTDNSTHDVQFYSDVNAAWVASESNLTVQWDLYEDSIPINGSLAGTPYEFAEERDVPLWGNFTYSSSPMSAENFSVQSGSSGNLRYQYVMQHSLQNTVNADFRPFATREPVFAYSHDFGLVSSASVRYTIGSVQRPIVRYLTSQGVVPLQPWWTQCYGDIYQMIRFHFNDFNDTQILASQFESQLKADVDTYYSANLAMVYSNSTPSTLPSYMNSTQGSNGTDQYGNQYIFDSGNGYGFLDPQNFSGIAVPDVQEAEAYYSIVALSARQIMGAYTLAIPPSSSGGFSASSNATDPLMFQKEISSNGNTNTVDVMYPAMPFFLYTNPNLLRYNLEPLIQNQEGGFYPNDYSMHDLGSHYPNATGHVEGNDEYMPVEESGNMILMSYAYYMFTNDTAYLQSHYPLLRQFASYLNLYSLAPGYQLSTDDFAGRLANQTNLAIKGIVGIAAMSKIAEICNDPAGAANYSATATSYYEQWEQLAIDPSGTHTLLAYQWRSSYSLLYNTYPALLLNLSIIPSSLYQMQSSFYPSVSQIFGIPLDSRHSYTKSDESMWTAATCEPETRRLFVNGLGYWLNNTSTDGPFSDLFNTAGTGEYGGRPEVVEFRARPVAGGHFSLLALERARMLRGEGTAERGGD
ncbi:MAG: hypothetical protein Q9166_001513 [cf. Caloplaca sp. 2 TL-2023]